MKIGGGDRILKKALGWVPLRRRVAFALRTHYFSDLGITLPLTHGLSCPVALESEVFSFSEIFVEDLYHDLLKLGPLPSRWLDLGCHAGYFSLWLEWRRRRAEAKGESAALLVDADARCVPGVGRLLELNHLPTWQVAHGVIAPGEGSLTFYEREVMSSSAQPGGSGHAVTVPIFDEKRIRAILPPPYDLIKVDIEGAELDFLEHYEETCRAARIILLEWHGASLGPDATKKLRARLQALGFARVDDLGPVPDPGQTDACGHLLAVRG